MNVISKDGTRIAYEKTGEGPAVILIDGAMGYRAFGPMLPLAKQLASHFTVYAYDRRGRGESGNTLPYLVEHEIEDITALVEEAGGKASLFGTSSGAVLALKAAASMGDKVEQLAIYEPPLVLDETEQKETLAFTEKMHGLLLKDDREGAATMFMERVAKMLNMPPEMVEGMRHSPVWAQMLSVIPTMDYDNIIMGDASVPSEAAMLTMPTLVMAGGASPESMQNAATTLATAIPNVKTTIIKDQGHDASAESLAPVLTSFFTN
jgi:pimeloyl-ACP methyl ester carboxylesterase